MCNILTMFLIKLGFVKSGQIEFRYIFKKNIIYIVQF